jgi:hypothetical protein
MKDMDLYFDEEKYIVYIKLSGRLDKKFILIAFDLSVSDKRYRIGMGRLWDFRDADLSSLDNETIVEMAQYSKRFPRGINNGKGAFVVFRDLEFGLTRMFEMSSRAKTPIHVFRTIAEAEEWMMPQRSER